MIWLVRLSFVLLFFAVLDVLYGLVGLALSKFPLRTHPRLHGAGLRLLAMSAIPYFYKHVLPRRCELCCGVDKCGNWTCPCYSSYRKDGNL